MMMWPLVLVLAWQTPLGEEEMRDKLRLINEDLARLESKLTNIYANTRRLSDEVGELELKRAVVKSKIAKHELELEDADQKLELNRQSQSELQARSDQQRKQLEQRMRSLYKRGSFGYAQLFLRQSRRTELINAYHYAKILTERDMAALEAFRQTLADLEAVGKRLVEIMATAEEARADLAAEEANLAGLVEERNNKLRQIRNQAQQNQQLLRDLELEKEELYMLVRRLTDTETDPMELRIPVSRYKGKLNWPVEGGVLRNFGVYRDPEFGTKRRQNGIHLAILRGDPVRAVYSGRVIYADWFKSYGNVIIMDHGEKVVTFYAHCDRLLVKKGDFIERDSVIATAGDSGSLEGPRLHFELRQKTEPQNPRNWLKKKTKRRR